MNACLVILFYILYSHVYNKLLLDNAVTLTRFGQVIHFQALSTKFSYFKFLKLFLCFIIIVCNTV